MLTVCLCCWMYMDSCVIDWKYICSSTMYHDMSPSSLTVSEYMTQDAWRALISRINCHEPKSLVYCILSGLNFNHLNSFQNAYNNLIKLKELSTRNNLPKTLKFLIRSHWANKSIIYISPWKTAQHIILPFSICTVSKQTTYRGKWPWFLNAIQINYLTQKWDSLCSVHAHMYFHEDWLLQPQCY